MNRNRWWNPRLGVVTLCLILVGLHFILKMMLSGYDIVSTIFATGESVQLWMISVAVIFTAVRFFVLVFAPPLFIWRLVMWVGTNK